jgi:predicted DNA-binding transcriptional regulator AlpA
MNQSLINAKETSKKAGLSRSTIYRLEMAGKFPQRITLSNRCCRWSLEEVNDWVSARLSERV